MGAPFGLKGFVKIKSLSGETAHFSKLKKVTLKQGKKEEIRDIAEICFQGTTVLMRFSGIDSPEAAATLKGAEIVAGREAAAPLKKGEYYVEDLKGLEVLSLDGDVLGRITNLVEGGNGNLAELQLLSGEKRLAPFIKEFFGKVDIKKGKIELLEPWILDQ